MSPILLFLFPLIADCALFDQRKQTLYFNDETAGEKLILTPYIKSGQIEKARKLSRVQPLAGNVESYSGFLTVNDKCDSNLFFWFFPAARDMENAPVSVWLQGGPGSSSLYGLFNENGPYHLGSDGELHVRNYSWHEISSCAFIDNPVGTGFSYASSITCYSHDETEVGNNLLEAITQIFAMFPQIGKNPFFITGESYAGKYVPALAYAIHGNNRVGNSKINLQGLAIGNGLVDPGNQLLYSEYLYQLGLIDTEAKKVFITLEDQCRSYIRGEDWYRAYECFDNLLDGDESDGNTYFYNVTGFRFYFNYLYSEQPQEGDVEKLIKIPEIRKAIHVGNAAWNNNTLVLRQLKRDVMKSVAPWLEELLEHYRVLLYNGQLDIIIPYVSTETYIKKLNWSSADTYKKAQRYRWMVDSELAGYSKTAGNLTEVLVRNAGHMVPKDQPKWAFDLISRFVHDKPFH